MERGFRLQRLGIRYYFFPFILDQENRTFKPLCFLSFLLTRTRKVFRSSTGLSLTLSRFLYFYNFGTRLYCNIYLGMQATETSTKGYTEDRSFLSPWSSSKRMVFSLKVGNVVFGCSHFLYPTIFQSCVR